MTKLIAIATALSLVAAYAANAFEPTTTTNGPESSDAAGTRAQGENPNCRDHISQCNWD